MQADKQTKTNRHADQNTSHPFRGQSNELAIRNRCKKLTHDHDHKTHVV